MKFSELCNFFARQWQATEAADAHRYVLYGGSRGPGKSRWLRWYCLRRLLKWAGQGHRGVRVALCSEDYPSLIERQISKIAVEFPPWLGELKETRQGGYGFYLRPQYGSGVIALRNLDDPGKWQGAEFAGIAVDELTLNRERLKTGERLFDALRTINRWTGIEDPFWIAASNPTGRGQKWVRALWIEGQMPEGLEGHEADFAFVPGLAGDNPHNSADFNEMLDTLPAKLRQAWRDGNWFVSFEGVVYEEFGAGNLTDAEPDPTQPVEIAVDDGYVDPRVILFIQRSGTRILVFDEMYHRRHLEQVCVGEVVERCSQRGWPRPQIAIGSPEAVELREHFRKANIPYRHLSHKIIAGIRVVRRLIEDGQGVRAIQVHRRCKNLIDELSSGYQYPPEGTRADDEEPMDANNHCVDALRYWAFMRARR